VTSGSSDRGPSAPGFRVVGAETLCEAGFFTVSRKQVVAPDGEELLRHVVHHPGAVVAVPLDDTDHVLMVRQYRVAVDRDLLELPAGKRDVDGEAPAATAAREIEEELGLRARSLELLCEFYNSPGFTDEYSYVYLATGLERAERRAASAEEAAMTIERVPLGSAAGLVAAGEIGDGKSIIGLLLAAVHPSRAGR
jgi:ADP-ribose pyrophosphatase